MEQQHCDAEAQLIAAFDARVEAERLALASVEAHIAAEQQAAELARQRDFAELSALQAANTKIEMQEQAIAALRENEEVERSLSEEVREELRNTKTLLETGKLLQRLKKTHRINRFSQVALVVSLLLSVGLWLGGTVTNAKAEHSTNNNTGNAVAQVAPRITEPVTLDNLKLSANLETSLPLQASVKENKQAEREF